MNKRETKHFDNASEICILHSSLNQLKSTTHNGELFHLSDHIAVRDLKIYPNINAVNKL